MSLSQPLLLVLGLLVAAALIVGTVILGRRRSAALAAAGVSVAGRPGHGNRQQQDPADGEPQPELVVAPAGHRDPSCGKGSGPAP